MPGAPEAIGANGETLEKYFKGIKGCSKKMEWSTAEVPLYQCMQRGQQTEAAGSHYTARKL